MNNGEAIGMMAGAYFVGRAELLRWINELTSLNYSKIEQTANGVFACHAFDALFPGEVRMEKVKFGAKKQYEFVHNYKILQSAFTRLDLKKQIDVEKLIRGKYQDNLEFIQWIKSFFDSHATEEAREYDGRARREAIIGRTRGPVRPALVPNRPRAVERSGISNAPRVAKAKSSADRLGRPAEPMVKKVEFERLKADNAKLEDHVSKLEQAAADNETEREFYFNKLRNVEVIIQDLEDEFTERDVNTNFGKAVEQIKAILYAVDDVLPEDEMEQPYEDGAPYEEETDIRPEEVEYQEAA